MSENATEIIQCPRCQARYQAPAKVLAAGTSVRCTKCNTVFTPGFQAAPQTAALPKVDATMISGPRQTGELPPDKNLTLSVIQGPLKGKVFAMSKPRIVLGRVGTDIVIDDPEVSRQHCAVEAHGASATLLDLGSRNGTFVNEAAVQTCPLEHLSEFRIGQNTFMFTVTPKTE